MVNITCPGCHFGNIFLKDIINDITEETFFILGYNQIQLSCKEISFTDDTSVLPPVSLPQLTTTTVKKSQQPPSTTVILTLHHLGPQYAIEVHVGIIILVVVEGLVQCRQHLSDQLRF